MKDKYKKGETKKIKHENFGNISFHPPIKMAIVEDKDATIAG